MQATVWRAKGYLKEVQEENGMKRAEVVLEFGYILLEGKS